MTGRVYLDDAGAAPVFSRALDARAGTPPGNPARLVMPWSRAHFAPIP